MKALKKAVSVMLSLIIVFSLFTIVPFPASAEAVTYVDTLDGYILSSSVQGYYNWGNISEEYCSSIDSQAVYNGTTSYQLKNNIPSFMIRHSDSGIFTTESGGSLYAESITAATLTVVKGALNVTDVTVSDRTFFTGGNTTVTGTANVAAVNLGCSSESDSITVGEYVFSSAEDTFMVVSNQSLFDGLHTYTGTLTHSGSGNDASLMAGRTLVLAHEHNSEILTSRSATPPTYDPATGEYTNGFSAHYTCDICGGWFVEDETTDGFECVDPAELSIPYFIFESAGDDCIVVAYNGADADVVIPDTVPDNYPDSSLRGLAVTGIDEYAFNSNETITSVTAGDNLTSIGTYALSGCSALTTVTFGSGLKAIGAAAFRDCPALESFTSTSTEDITSNSDTTHSLSSFDADTEVVFRGPHGSALLTISQNYSSSSFSPTDRHEEPAWTWDGYSSATAVFNCDGCELAGGETFTDNEIEITEGETGTVYTTSVTVDGETYTDAKTLSYWKQLQAEIDSKPDGIASFIRLQHDVVADADDVPLVIPSGKHIILMFNEHTVNRDMDAAAENGNVFTNNGTLTLMGEGTVTGGKNTSNGGAIVNNGTLNLTTITISDNTTAKDGGAIYNSGTLNVNSGTITGNSAGSGTSGSGGAISAHKGTITIDAGEITNNTAANHGGAIYLGADSDSGDTATLNLNGGEITGNTAGGQGGGILHNGILNVSGSLAYHVFSGGPIVKDNTGANGKTDNIYLRPEKLINVTDSFDPNNTMLGVTKENNATGVFTSGLLGNGSAAHFFSDNPDYYVTADSDGEATLVKSRFVKHSLTLHGDIGVNFYLDLSNDELAQGATVSFALNGEALSTYTIDKDNDAKVIDGKTYYKASCWVCAPEMADTITATLSIGEEEVETDRYSVKTYADTIFADDNQPDDLKTLVSTMVNYGAATQVQFSTEHPNNDTLHDAANLANEDIDYDLVPLTDTELGAITASIPDKDAINAQLSGAGLTYHGYTMLLHSKTILRFYFQKDSPDTDISGIRLDGNTAQNYNDYFAYVEVEGIPAYELKDNYTLSVNSADLGSYSALSYIKDVLTDTEADETLVNTVTAMYRYHEAAVAYFTNNG